MNNTKYDTTRELEFYNFNSYWFHALKPNNNDSKQSGDIISLHGDANKIMALVEKYDGQGLLCVAVNEHIQDSNESKDIKSINTLIIDIDVRKERKVGHVSTREDHEHAIFAAQKAKEELEDIGFSVGIVKDSGNGCQLMLRVDIPLNFEAKTSKEFLMEYRQSDVYKSIDALYLKLKSFDDDVVEVDSSVMHDINRRVKLAGTINKKDTAQTEDRRANIIYYERPTPETITKNSNLLLSLLPNGLDKEMFGTLNKDNGPLKQISITELQRALTYIPAHDGQTWHMVCCGLKRYAVDTKNDMFFLLDEWSKTADNYVGRDECRRRYDSIVPLQNGYSIGSIIYMAKSAGFEFHKNLITDKPELPLPQRGYTRVSPFIIQVTDNWLESGRVYLRVADDSIVELVDTKLIKIKPTRAITLIDRAFSPITFYYDKKNDIHKKQKNSAKESDTRILLDSRELKSALPQIERILSYPLPILKNDKLFFPKRGYNPDLKLYIPNDAPVIDPDIPIDEATSFLIDLYSEFCFKEEIDLFKALASLLTPFLRGLYSDWSVRTPVFIFFANRERAGKDFCAGIRTITYLGFASEEPPLSTGQKGDSNEEVRKKIMSALLSGKTFLHFSNNRGHINSAVFEQVATARRWSDRILGGNETASFDNSLELSLSGNIGTTLTPDLANRSIIIDMHLAIENANKRTFSKPNLHAYVYDNRSKILSALYALVREWNAKGRPLSKTPFASYPEWAGIIGGIFESVAWPNPIKSDDSAINLDSELEDMKLLFELCYEKHPDKWLKKGDIQDVIVNSECDIFTWCDFSEKKHQTKFGLILRKYIDRELSEIRLTVDSLQGRSQRQTFKFTKTKVSQINFDKYLSKGGHVGHLGHVVTPTHKTHFEKIYNRVYKVANVAKVTNFKLPDPPHSGNSRPSSCPEGGGFSNPTPESENWPPWSEADIIHQPCQFETCKDSPCNRGKDGRLYCRPHFDGLR